MREEKKVSPFKLLFIVVAMFGFGYVMVPLYDVFCDITGLNGKTGRVAESEIAKRYQVNKERLITVEFTATNLNEGQWTFKPKVFSMDVHPGQIYAAAYTASNLTNRDLVSQAVPSVVPSEAAIYFNKTECFCFSKQILKAGETVDMPVRFVIDPEVPEHVDTITLAYTFFDVTEKSVN